MYISQVKLIKSREEINRLWNGILFWKSVGKAQEIFWPKDGSTGFNRKRV